MCHGRGVHSVAEYDKPRHRHYVDEPQRRLGHCRGNGAPPRCPGRNDRAIFNDNSGTIGVAVGLNLSNDVVGNVLFSATTKSMFWKNSTNTLTVLNSFVMDEGASGTATNTLRTGYIAVTNSSGTGTFQVGNYTSGGRGVLIMQQQAVGGGFSALNYPTLIANNFLVTSNSSTISFTAGTLSTYGGSIDRGTNVAFAGSGTSHHQHCHLEYSGWDQFDYLPRFRDRTSWRSPPAARSTLTSAAPTHSGPLAARNSTPAGMAPSILPSVAAPS